MTKERKLAIQMWERIVEALENGERDTKYARPIASAIKAEFCTKHNLEWKFNCWFCQYVRQDYRSNMPSRINIPHGYNGCQYCPLYKEHEDIFTVNDECGCTDGTLWMQVEDENNVYAAKRILELLKGEQK